MIFLKFNPTCLKLLKNTGGKCGETISCGSVKNFLAEAFVRYNT